MHNFLLQFPGTGVRLRAQVSASNPFSSALNANVPSAFCTSKYLQSVHKVSISIGKKVRLYFRAGYFVMNTRLEECVRLHQPLEAAFVLDVKPITVPERKRRSDAHIKQQMSHLKLPQCATRWYPPCENTSKTQFGSSVTTSNCMAPMLSGSASSSPDNDNEKAIYDECFFVGTVAYFSQIPYLEEQLIIRGNHRLEPKSVDSVVSANFRSSWMFRQFLGPAGVSVIHTSDATSILLASHGVDEITLLERDDGLMSYTCAECKSNM
ncbi:hypothetical protein EDB19DRAFT_1827892 [Suillus lakei]|nr:hypothetical protein EDB19DRAFT_1827892 [Suillus lakei]